MCAMPANDTYVREVERWHAARIQRLTAPDGWLSLVGLEWLRPGANRVGSADDNDVVLARLPPHLGTVTWAEDGTLTIELDPAAAARIDGRAVTHAELLDDSHTAPTVVSFGNVSFIALDRSGRKGLRVRDSQAPTRTRFAGIQRFPVDPGWRIVADWTPLSPPFQLATGTVIGTVEHYPAPGMAVFRRRGERFTVYPVLETPAAKQLFLIFADQTSGVETHAAARFLYADPPHDGKLVLDFNRAYNPPCCFTAFATCPLAPPENHLAVRVDAGELKYAPVP
ncbi:MAG: DUF1684 domain-containing protein [Rhodanobacteraceae bacterium]|nr:MAG: DUF1684 domain-containing protein [Rhodanobacteraceae bacterium]